jgi:hypothetical protein
MDAITYFGGKTYLHSDYTTAAKQKNLPESVINAIQGNVREDTAPVDETTQVEPTPQVEQTPVEPTQTEPTTSEQTVTNETNNN